MKRYLHHKGYHHDEDLDETVGLAGWMYTDLLLGLAVVFLGTVAFLVPALAPDSDAEGTPATTVVQTTTTTIPVKLCPIVYKITPLGESPHGFRVTVSNTLRGTDLKDAFVTGLQQLIDEDNKGKTDDQQLSNVESLTLAFVNGSGGINVSAGESVVEGELHAQTTLNDLQAGLPALFQPTVVRSGGNYGVGAGTVLIEVFPIVQTPCLSGT